MKSYQLICKLSPLIAFVFGVWYFCIRLLGYHFEYIPGDLGDSRFINYLLEHGYNWLKGNGNSFWDAGFMYPFKNTIALSDNMLGTLPIYSIWRLVGFSQETAYQLWWISICALNYWCSFIVFKKWFNRFDVAIILAWIFAFSVFNLGQLNYMQMIIRFAVPLAFYAAYKLVSSPSLKYLGIYCLAISIQFYCVVYTGFYLFYFSLLFIVIYYLSSKKWNELRYFFQKGKLVYTLSIVFLACFVMAWLLIPYFSMSKTVGLRMYKEVITNLPLWNSFLFTPKASSVWGFLHNIVKPNVSNWCLHYLFVGILPFLVMIASPVFLLYSWYKKIKVPVLLKALIIISFLIAVLHVRTESGLSLYALIFKLPGINSMRVLNRFMHVEIFILLVLLGYVFLKMNKNYLLVVCLIVFVDNCFSPQEIPREKKEFIVARRIELVKELKTYDLTKVKAVALIDTTAPVFVNHLDIMMAAQSVGLPTINGYSSYCPDAFGVFFLNASEDGLNKWITNKHLKQEDVLILKR